MCVIIIYGEISAKKKFSYPEIPDSPKRRENKI
jgi:hypothetical protein